MGRKVLFDDQNGNATSAEFTANGQPLTFWCHGGASGFGGGTVQVRRHIKKYPEKKRERFLTPNETKRLGATLKQMHAEGVESNSAVNCIKLLLLTGCRLSEIQTLQWKFIDWDDSVIKLPDSRTGAIKMVPPTAGSPITHKLVVRALALPLDVISNSHLKFLAWPVFHHVFLEAGCFHNPI